MAMAERSPSEYVDEYVATSLKAVPSVISMDGESVKAVDDLLGLVTVEMQLLRLSAIGVSEQKVVPEATVLPEDVGVARRALVAAWFANVDQVQAELIGWGWALALNANLKKTLTASGCTPEAAESISTLFSDRLFSKLIATGLTGARSSFAHAGELHGGAYSDPRLQVATWTEPGEQVKSRHLPRCSGSTTQPGRFQSRSTLPQGSPVTHHQWWLKGFRRAWSLCAASTCTREPTKANPTSLARQITTIATFVARTTAGL